MSLEATMIVANLLTKAREKLLTYEALVAKYDGIYHEATAHCQGVNELEAALLEAAKDVE